MYLETGKFKNMHKKLQRTIWVHSQPVRAGTMGGGGSKAEEVVAVDQANGEASSAPKTPATLQPTAHATRALSMVCAACLVSEAASAVD